MNTENILKVADAIEQHSIPGLGFNMAGYFRPAGERLHDQGGHSCGTVACIAGWAYALQKGIGAGEVPTLAVADHDAFDEAAEFLGLTEAEATNLFFAKGHPTKSGCSGWERITEDEALSTLRHLAATGKVDWTVAS